MNEKCELFIIGGGVAGQLAKKFFESKYDTRIAGVGQKSNTALFRSKSAEIPLMLGARAKEISVDKYIHSSGFIKQTVTPKDANRYSMKVCGKICKRSICDVGEDTVKRYVFDVPNTVDVSKSVESISRAGSVFEVEFSDGSIMRAEKIISTIPMPQIVNIVNKYSEHVKDDMEFKYSEITVARFKLGCEVTGDWQQTIYFPDDDCHVYRATLNNDGILAEYIDGTSDEIVKQEILIVAAAFGIKTSNIIGREIHFMKHGKIIGGKENKQRLKIMSELTEKFNIYSLGRYATWNESVKTEDLIHDLKKIDTMMSMSDDEKKYNLRKVMK